MEVPSFGVWTGPKAVSSLAVLVLLFLLAGPRVGHAQLVKPTDRRVPAGLWVGEVTLNQVATLEAPTVVAPTVDTAGFRILIHIDTKGTTQLLKDVSIATVTNAAGGESTVLATDLTAPGLKVVQREGRPLIRRLGTVGYDWDGTGAEAYRAVMNPALGTNNACSVTLTNGLLHATNPFRHPFHPDHQKGRTLIRQLVITVKAPDPSNTANDGVLSLTGDYEERIRGILPLTDPARSSPPMLWVRGTVALRRVSENATLD